MGRILLTISASVFLLMGCSSQSVNRAIGLPEEIEKKMEEQVKVDIVAPLVENYQVKYAEVRYPLGLTDTTSPGNHRIVATIVYTDKIGPLIELSNEQKAEMEKKQNRTITYGEYEGKPIIILEISSMKNSIGGADVKSQQIEGINVESAVKEANTGKYAFYSFNYEDAAYITTFLLNDSFTEENAVDFNKSIIITLKQSKK